MTNEAKVRLLEVVSVLAIIGSAMAMAVPKSGELKRRDTASQVSADVEVVRAAVYAFYSDSAYFPVKVTGERVPENLVAYLPRGFSGTRPYGSLEYRNWPVRMGEGGAEAPNVVGVTVTVRDPRIGATLVASSPRTAKFAVGDKYTFIFFGS